MYKTISFEKNKTGILEKLIQYPEKIKDFAINVLRIMKLSPKGILPVNFGIFDINRLVTFKSFEIAGMILSTERLRSKKSLLLSYIEFYKLKHITDLQDSQSMLLDMFDKDEPILRFPASPGGVEYIQMTSPYYIYKRFLNMITYSPEYETIQKCENINTQHQLMDEFFRGKLEKIRATFENRQPKFKSNFKSAIQNHKMRLNTFSHKTTPLIKNIQTYENNIENVMHQDEYFENYSNSFPNTDYDSFFDSDISYQPRSIQQDNFNYHFDNEEITPLSKTIQQINTNQKESTDNTDEYFDSSLNNLSASDYADIWKNAISFIKSSNQLNNLKDPLNTDEYFDSSLNNLSDSDYDNILNRATSSIKSSNQSNNLKDPLNTDEINHLSETNHLMENTQTHDNIENSINHNKKESNSSTDEYFDLYTNIFSDADYSFFVDNAMSSNSKQQGNLKSNLDNDIKSTNQNNRKRKFIESKVQSQP